ncbi:MAG: phosphopentomutase [Desulfuromonadales bacterium GWD2_61_12]|nr:MAG: phosphopentomutase [Desulfuromonadales bacterium GWC2_61_20]OGR36436.1 MAG: phosphopentomutase [Desulfuromonadales bacterium GWD2_61_12]HAD03538.1 phosphopentomutase [Desulfuromonas sp.]HBT83155.1 phosphopentomutase [Desulfuromonas sp.]
MPGPYQRVVLLTLDGVGIGALPDATEYGDAAANTLLHVAEACGGLHLPHLQRLGLGCLVTAPGLDCVPHPLARVARLREKSIGKDTTTGHWELTGVIQRQPLSCFPEGFPAEIIAQFVSETGLVPLGNIAASGTEIIKVFGEEHLRSGRPIVYTSSDSVFQIAAHEAIIPLDRLYAICRSARRILDPYRVGRVIARPFVGTCAADFRRTPHRHDFSIPPTGGTILDSLAARDIAVIGIGKIYDIFAGRGVAQCHLTADNRQGMAQTLQALVSLERGLVFSNLVDFDMLYGHRRDVFGFGAALEDFDRWLPELISAMRPDDLLIVTADHGCDPTTPGTDHSREYVPVLAWSPSLAGGAVLADRPTFADVAATVAAAFAVDFPIGESLLG